MVPKDLLSRRRLEPKLWKRQHFVRPIAVYSELIRCDQKSFVNTLDCLQYIMVHISSVLIQCEQYIFSQTIRAESTLIKREISETEKKNLIKIFRLVEENNINEREEIFSERVRAGKRTYFFDVKATRSNDYYLTITESKRRYKDDGFTYEKHKIFLYKEDFNKFVEALNNTVNHVKEDLMPDVDFDQFDRQFNEDNNNTKAEKSEIDTELKWD